MTIIQQTITPSSNPSIQESNPQNSSLNRARTNGYEDAFYIIHHLLKECDKAPFEDQRVAITEKIFNHLIQNPTILIYDAEFRNSVINKMNQLETHISNRIEKLNKAEYDEAIKMMRLSLRLTVINSEMRASIYSNLKSIVQTLKHYQEWAKGEGLKNCFNSLRVVLNTIKTNPNYV
jgi:hypothetical protein